LNKDIKCDNLASEARGQWSKKAHFAWLPPPYATFKSSDIPDDPLEQHHFSSPTTVSGISYCANCGVHLRTRDLDECFQDTVLEESHIPHINVMCGSDVLGGAHMKGHEDSFWHYVEGNRLLI
jgi:hypothetical protein